MRIFANIINNFIMAGLGWASLIQPAFNAGTGIYQLIKANQLEKEAGDRPNRSIPTELQFAYDRAKTNATLRELPSMAVTRDRLRGSTASGASAISQKASGGEALGALAKLYGGEQTALADLGVKSDEFWMNNQDRLTNMQGQIANEQVKNWEWNKAQPYLNEMDEISKLRSGGLQNMSGALGSGTQNALYSLNQDPNAFALPSWLRK